MDKADLLFLLRAIVYAMATTVAVLWAAAVLALALRVFLAVAGPGLAS